MIFKIFVEQDGVFIDANMPDIETDDYRYIVDCLETLKIQTGKSHAAKIIEDANIQASV